MSFIGTGIAIGNIAGALSASLGTALGIGALGSTAVGAGGIGSLLGATVAGTAGSALAGTAGTGLGEAATALGIGGVESAATPAVASTAAPTITTSSTGGIMPGSVISAMGGPEAIPAGAVPASSGSGITPSAISAVGTSAAPSGALATPSTTLTSGGFTGFGHAGDFLAKEAGVKALTEGVGGINQSIANTQTEEESDKVKQQYFSGWAHGGDVQHVAREGGSIRLRNGDFIIPADVVSALGNGSSKAGAKYLTHLMRALEAGPAPKAGSLAKQRTRERQRA